MSVSDFPRPLPEDRAAILFAALDVAQTRGEYAKAAELQDELRALGWVVTRKRPRPAPTDQKAAPL
jgi:hypothetical protein